MEKNSYPRILFIDSSYSTIEVNETIGLEVLEAYLSSVFESITIDVSPICQIITDPDLIWNYDIVGISTSISAFDQLDSLLQMSNNMLQESIIVVGGLYGTYAYKEVLAKYPFVFCSIGEGESTWEGIIRAYLSSRGDRSAFVNGLSGVPNLVFTMNGSLVETDRAVIDLSTVFAIPKHTRAAEVTAQSGIVRIEGSRGCPWNACSFCVLKWKYNFSTWRGYPIEKVIRELILLEEHHAKAVYFTDEEFLGGTYERTMAMVNAIIELKKKSVISSDMFFAVSTSTKTLLGEYTKCSAEQMVLLLSAMKTAGFRSFFIGIESGSNSQLVRYNKGTDAQSNSTALKLLESLGISADIGYILFDPDVTIDELLESLEFISQNGLRGHMSRFAKRLRLVPKTAYCRSFMAHSPHLQFDMDTIEYHYAFTNHDVEKIFQIYNEWESWHLKETLRLQGLVRGTVSGSELSSAINQLGSLRNGEFDALFHILNSVYEHRKALHDETYKQYIQALKYDNFFLQAKYVKDDEQLDMVDESDCVIGHMGRNFIYSNDMHCYRVIGIFLRTHDGKFLIPTRSLSCQLFPGRYDFSVAGHVSTGETYEEAAYREAQEELGIDPDELNLQEYLYVRYPNDLGISSFAKFYYGDCPSHISIDKQGIASIEYLTVDEISEMVRLSPERFKPDFIPAFSELANFQK